MGFSQIEENQNSQTYPLSTDKKKTMNCPNCSSPEKLEKDVYNTLVIENVCSHWK